MQLYGEQISWSNIPQKGRKRTNTRPLYTMHLIIDELFTGIDYGRVRIKGSNQTKAHICCASDH